MSTLWLILYNARFWTDTVHAMWNGTVGSGAFLASLGVLVLCLQALLLLLLPSRRLMLIAASLLFIVAASSSYFSWKYGIVMDKDMLRNVLATDTAEIRDLISFDLMLRIVILGLIPAAFVWTVPLPAMKWSTRLRKQALATSVIVLACVIALFSASASYAVFFREHKPIRFTLAPAAPVTSVLAVLMEKSQRHGDVLINASGPAIRSAPAHPRPLALVVVVGETARADNFQLGGYERLTNPRLSSLDDVIYFPNVTSCGTATAVSVPCMFSHFARREFDVDESSRYSNLLDALQEAGLGVEWRDNNAGCKGVCSRITQIYYGGRKASELCRASYCYDEVMLSDLPETLATLTHDTVIVMHQIGSHGPAYSERYPHEFEKFRPACHSNQLQSCSTQAVVNAYDNTIAYTDHFLARTIEALQGAADRADAMLVYVSDHGESLGEQGLYLHGLPYAFAPQEQKHVPMLMWLSPEYATRRSLDVGCMRRHAADRFSHDNLYHTVLGAAEVLNASYDATLDMLATCRDARGTQNHT